jgi:putative membrane protein
MHFLVKLMLSSIAVLVASYIIPGIHVPDIKTAIVVAAVLAFLNAVVKPIMVILTIPITLLTMGLFLIIINGLLIILADYIVTEFAVDGFIPALLFSLFIAITNSVFESLVKESKRRDDR